MSEASDNQNPKNHPAGARPAHAGGPRGGAAELPEVDVADRGAAIDGVPQRLDRRIFMQLLVFSAAPGGDAARAIVELGEAFEAAGVDGVLYEDVNDPRGVGVLTWSDDPAHFVETVRPILAARDDLDLRPEFTMLGRSYTIGYEQDLEYYLLRRSVEMATKPDCKWAIWYPLRRSGEFSKLSARERGPILSEHGKIGRAYGEKGLGSDIRLACHGLDANDNEFVIALLGARLHPLSHLVQRMRSTTQTSTYITQMGPFFVGHVAWRRDSKVG